MRHIWQNKAWKVALAMALLLLLGGAALASGTPAIDWWVIGSGGGSASNGIYSLNGTLGQAVVGTSANDPYGLCAGFWCAPWGEGGETHLIYLPIVLRAYP